MLSSFLVGADLLRVKLFCDCKTYPCFISLYATDRDDVPKSIAAIHLLSCSTGVAFSIFLALDSGPLDKAMISIREVSVK